MANEPHSGEITMHRPHRRVCPENISEFDTGRTLRGKIFHARTQHTTIPKTSRSAVNRIKAWGIRAVTLWVSSTTWSDSEVNVSPLKKPAADPRHGNNGCFLACMSSGPHPHFDREPHFESGPFACLHRHRRSRSSWVELGPWLSYYANP